MCVIYCHLRFVSLGSADLEVFGIMNEQYTDVYIS